MKPDLYVQKRNKNKNETETVFQTRIINKTKKKQKLFKKI